MEEKNKMDTEGLADGVRGCKRENKDVLSRRRETIHGSIFGSASGVPLTTNGTSERC